MSRKVISVEDVSKLYRLGMLNSDMLGQDLKRWWHKARGKEDPFLKEAIANDRTTKSESEFVWALQDINFDVKQGEVLGLIGKNGAGKSTMLKILSRVTAPTKGQIKIRGRIASLLEVGTGFQPELSGRENIFLNGAVLGLRKKEIAAKFDEIVAFSGVEAYIDTPVKRYSSGMYVRLAFAVAAHLEPEILVIDEVLAVGDVEFQKKCLGKMQDVSGQGRTIIFVSHNMEAVSRLCTRGILLANGKMVYDGTSENAIQQYLAHNNQSLESIDLKDRKDRQGSGAARFVKTWFTDKNNKVVTYFKSGDFVNIHALVEPVHSGFDAELFFTTSIYDSKGLRIMSLASGLKNQKIRINKKTEIKWTIEKIQLASDDYAGELIMFQSPRGMDMVDQIEQGFKLIINEGDFYGTGAIQKKGRDKIFSEFTITTIEQ